MESSTRWNKSFWVDVGGRILLNFIKLHIPGLLIWRVLSWIFSQLHLKVRQIINSLINWG